MRAIALILLLGCGPLAVLPLAAQRPAPVVVLTLNGVIGPAKVDYIRRSLEKAVEQNAQLVVLKMDTPGGLELSMREIIKHILASKIPVAGFVTPNGARAASAGTYILYASHIAAMAPATNLGAATPVAIGAPLLGPQSEPGGLREPRESRDPAATKGKPEKDGGELVPGAQSTAQTMARKHTNDAAAFIRGLAQLRGRNAEWADKAVREAVSLSAQEALQLKVIDVISADVEQLLKQIDGRRLSVLGEERLLATGAAEIVEYQPDWRTRLLAVIADPGIAYLLLMIGVVCLLFEFYNPGMVVPGVIGAISLLVAMFAFQTLPVSIAGLALIVLGVGLLIAEYFAPGFGILGMGGITAFVIGSIMLFDSDAPGYSVPWQLIAAVTAVGAAFLLVVLNFALRARRLPVVSGREQMLGASGEVLDYADGGAFARVRGEVWKVRANVPAGEVLLRTGQRVRVVGIDGLVLAVEPAPPGGDTK
ncbi:MAG: nodulation protein NfeD [Betaproteobacteria bacterium]|nr:nodulation protein NfeD [Betaproteobacteria bacterium]